MLLRVSMKPCQVFLTSHSNPLQFYLWILSLTVKIIWRKWHILYSIICCLPNLPATTSFFCMVLGYLLKPSFFLLFNWSKIIVKLFCFKQIQLWMSKGFVKVSSITLDYSTLSSIYAFIFIRLTLSQMTQT